MRRDLILIVAGLLLLGAPLVARGEDASCATPVVETAAGRVCGLRTKGALPGEATSPVLAYLGIPYAAPPTSALRWAAPRPREPWKDVLDASHFGAVCPQHPAAGGGIEMSEDCLSLNVWTPDVKGSLPVMVFLHGGSFLYGGSAAPVYDGANLAAAGPVVMVTLNYRIGALGYMAGIEGLEGNYGILDQQLALTWVRDNIRAFGGDPARVTLFGESAGASSVAIHLAAPSSRGLFRAAILESNPAGLPYKTVKDGERFARALRARLGCDSADDPVACMRALPADQIALEQGKTPLLGTFLLGLSAFLPWSPVVGSAPMLAQPISVPITVPVILGTNLDEGALFIAIQQKELGPIDASRFDLETDIFFPGDAQKVRDLYHAKRGDYAAALSALSTDYLFTCANRYMMGHVRAPVFGYQFTHAPSFPIWPSFPVCDPSTGKVCHAAELPFVFGNPVAVTFGATPRSFTEAEAALSRTIMRYWTHFATHLSPSFHGAPEWSAFTTGEPIRLILNETLSTSVDLDAHCGFWNSIGYDLRGLLD